MSDPTSGWTRYASPAVLFGVVLTGVAAIFNAKFGYTLGGSDQLRCFGMAAVAVAALGLKDYFFGRSIVMIKERRFGVFVLCLIATLLGASVSLLAAFGSASTGQAEKSNPLQAQIDAYTAAKATEASTLEQIGKLGDFPAVTQADLDAALALVDKTVSRRTNGCAVIAPPGSGPKAQSWNAEACRGVLKLRPDYEKGQQAMFLYADLKAARAIIAKGAPESADALSSNLSDIWQKITGQGDVKMASVIAGIIALIVEVGGPISWAVFQLDTARNVKPVPVPERVPEPQPSSTPPRKPKKRFRSARSSKQKNANEIAAEMRARGEVPKFHVVRSEYQKRHGETLPKVTAHRACG